MQHHDLTPPLDADHYVVVDSSGRPRWVGLTITALERIAREMEEIREARNGAYPRSVEIAA